MDFTCTVAICEPPRATCVACAGPTAQCHAVIAKVSTGQLGVLCCQCIGSALARPVLLLEIEVATAWNMDVPQLASLFVRHGVFEIPTTSQAIDEALGNPVGTTRNVWSDR